jgi:UDP-galactopyranose mutase
VWFAGRLATYRYYNMDQIIGQALATFRRIDEQLPKKEITTSIVKLQSEFADVES